MCRASNPNPNPNPGFCTYAAVAALAAAHAAAPPPPDPAPASPSPSPSSVVTAGLAAGAASLGAAAAASTALLAARFADAPCAWCLASAALSTAIAGAVFGPMRRDELRRAAAPGGAAAAATALVLTLSWAAVDAPAAAAADSLPFDEPEVTRLSSPRAVALAKKLRAAGARMYGAFWCSHCFEQRQAFGAAAAADLPYVECYPNGFGRGVPPASACVAAGVQGFPSWAVGGRLVEGEQSFDDLEAALARSAARESVEAALGAGGGLPAAPALR